MARIIVNKNKEIKGLLTATRKIDNVGNIIISGELLTHRYIEEITSIETERYIFEDVCVHCEEFASNDFMIRYEFFANSMSVVGHESNLPLDVINEIEKEYFQSEEKELLHKEVYTKWISENKK